MPAKTPPPAPSLVDVLVPLSFQVQAVLARAGAEHDLSLVQVRLLGVLRDREPGVLELARYLGLDKSSVTGLVNRAERHGLVRRRPSPRDGRAIQISLTPHGRQLADEGAAEVARAIQALAAGLSPADQKRLAVLAARLLPAPALAPSR